MARKVKNTNNPELDGPAFFAAIAQIEQEKGIKSGYMMEKITQALISAYRRDHEGVGDNLTVEADPHACTVRMFLKKDIVEQVDNPGMEISLAEARRAIPHAQLGDVVRIEIKPKSLGRIAACKLIKEDFKITREHGQWFEKNGVWMTALFHPAAILRDPRRRPETFEDLKTIQAKILEVCDHTY